MCTDRSECLSFCIKQSYDLVTRRTPHLQLFHGLLSETDSHNELSDGIKLVQMKVVARCHIS